MTLNTITPFDFLRFQEVQKELEVRAKRNYIRTLFPETGPRARHLYKKQMEFFKAGHDFRQRMFVAANRTGKTLGALAEVTYHATGLYPDWWEGKRFTKPNNWWIAGVSSRDVKSVLQDTLLGPAGDFGTGLLPHHTIVFESLTTTTKADTIINTIRVRHYNTLGQEDGVSTLEFKSFEQGRQSFQGTARNILLDEEAPLEIYSECLARTATDDYILMATFTPLKGMTEVITNFMPDGFQLEGPIYRMEEGLPVLTDKYVVNATWNDIPHLDEKTKKDLEASFHPHVREARTKGIPALGSGAIYPVPLSTYLIEPFEIPKHWRKVFGMDVGWHRTAAIWAALDPDSGVTYLYSEHYLSESPPSTHAEAIKARGDWIPGVIDSAANGRSQNDGERLMEQYKSLGLKISNADKSVEAGLQLCWELLSSGRVKVFSSCFNFLKEIAIYQRDEKGRIVKKNDHLMDAWRYLMMSGRDLAKNEQEAKPHKYGVEHGYVSPQYRRGI
jgi:phage terminase large subunit-like protein